ncbi:nucleotidyltransferase family protein [Legionella dresdenensis]|uniref:Nucleotidyltransferase family protein n=1 Tax=Legionella dresdenensis TaxID=450200 RepID=A0ABV8CGI6_9GAMM
MTTAMILAAGRGERLKPITYSTPKAMCRIKGIPLIETHVTNLVKAGITRIIINHAYLGDQIRRHLRDGRQLGAEIIYSPEPPGGLETGGGIFHALPLLGKEPFITVNADIVTDFNFEQLQLPADSLAHLVLAVPPQAKQSGDFGLEQGKVVNTPRQYIFSGITCYHPEAFANCERGRYSVITLLRQLADSGRLTGSLMSDYWIDIGSVQRLTLAQQQR